MTIEELSKIGKSAATIVQFQTGMTQITFFAQSNTLTGQGYDAGGVIRSGTRAMTYSLESEAVEVFLKYPQSHTSERLYRYIKSQADHFKSSLS